MLWVILEGPKLFNTAGTPARISVITNFTRHKPNFKYIIIQLSGYCAKKMFKQSSTHLKT